MGFKGVFECGAEWHTWCGQGRMYKSCE